MISPARLTRLTRLTLGRCLRPRPRKERCVSEWWANLGGMTLSKHVISFSPLPLQRSSCMSLLPFALFYGPFPLCFSLSVLKGLRRITACTEMDAVHCSFYLHSAPRSSSPPPPHRHMLWHDSDGEEGWRRVELQTVQMEGWHSNCWKNVTNVGCMGYNFISQESIVKFKVQENSLSDPVGK